MTDELRKTAYLIAKVIADTPSEARGDLLLLVAGELEKLTQHFTATCVRMIADKYNDA